MTDVTTLLALPIDTLTVLAGGYLGYRLAYTGKDQNHKTADTVFLTLVFGLVAKVALGWFKALDCPVWVESISAILSALVISAFWRRWGQRVTFKLARKLRVSTHDDHRSALDSVVADDGMKVSQIIVRRQDGVSVMCNDVGAFEAARTGPFYFGPDGSVALYVTNQRLPNEDDWDDVSSDLIGAGGDRLITVIPADQIVFTQIRNK